MSAGIELTSLMTTGLAYQRLVLARTVDSLIRLVIRVGSVIGNTD